MGPLVAELTDVKSLAQIRQADTAQADLTPPALSVLHAEDLSDTNSIQTDIFSALATPITVKAATTGTKYHSVTVLHLVIILSSLVRPR